jgi:ribosomal protein S18 acetylase RimI-like enzyme
MPSLRIEKATLENLECVAKLFDLYRQFYEQESNYELAKNFIFNRVSKNESVILIAVEDSDSIVGLCQLYPTFCSVMAEPIFVLYDLFVLESKRKIGAGRALLLAAEKHAKLAGVKRMDLTTAKSNFAAQTLYESLGWERDNVFLTYNRNTSS